MLLKLPWILVEVDAVPHPALSMRQASETISPEDRVSPLAHRPTEKTENVSWVSSLSPNDFFTLYLWDTLSRSLLLIVYSLMPWLLALSLAVIEEVQWYTFVPFFSDFYFFKRLSLPLDQSCAGPSNICRAPFSQLPSLAVSNIDWSRHWKWNPDRGFIGGQRCFQTNHIKEL